METYNFSKKVVFSPEVYETISKEFPNDYYSISFSSDYYIWDEELSDEFAEELLNSDNILQFERILRRLWKENGIKLGLKKELPKENKLDAMRIALTKVIESISSFTFWYQNWLRLYYPELLLENRNDVIPVDIDSSTNAIDQHVNKTTSLNSQVDDARETEEPKGETNQIFSLANNIRDKKVALLDPSVAQEDHPDYQSRAQPSQDMALKVTEAII